jgi:hypothetical protein
MLILNTLLVHNLLGQRLYFSKVAALANLRSEELRDFIAEGQGHDIDLIDALGLR